MGISSLHKITTGLNKQPKALFRIFKEKAITKSVTQNFKLKPELFPPPEKGSPNLHAKYKPFPYYNEKIAAFLEDVKPKELPVCNLGQKDKIIYVSNYNYPSGTISCFSSLSETLYTDGLAQCSALAIIDRKNNLQVLTHLFPGYPEKENEKIIKHIFSSLKQKNLELSIVAGTEGSVSTQFLVEMAKKYAPKAKLNFYNFPTKINYINEYERGLVLHNGELSCCDDNYFINRVINPLDRTIACEPAYLQYGGLSGISSLLKELRNPANVSPRYEHWEI